MQEILDNWTKQRSAISDMDEAQLKTLISLELKGRARSTVVIPSHQRQSRLRTQRERESLEARMAQRQAKLAAIEAKNGPRK